MEVTIEEMRAVCVTHYVERGYSLAHAELIVGNKECEILRIYDCIQEEQKKVYPQPITAFPYLYAEETAAE